MWGGADVGAGGQAVFCYIQHRPRCARASATAPPVSAVARRECLAASFTSSGACPMAKDPPAHFSIDTSLYQSPMVATSLAEIDSCSVTCASPCALLHPLGVS